MLLTEPLRFSTQHLTRPAVSGIDVVTTLEHFAIITYTVDPASLARHMAPRFEPVCIRPNDGTPRALVSVVPFHDRDFHAAAFPSPRMSFGQTNYRAYVIDRETGQHSVWFFGTTLDSITVMLPRHLWKLPWHRGRIKFACELEGDIYRSYEMTTASSWAPVRLALEDAGSPVSQLDGFPDFETAVLILTHPLSGFYRRRDGALGSYQVGMIV